MVYWGCSTPRNRCVWTVCAAFAIAATVLLCVGAGQMWVCNHRPTPIQLTQQQNASSCRIKAGIFMALCPVVVILGLLPSLLFFQSCLATPPPPPIDWEKGVPASGITVVRRTSNGAAVYRYDSSGRLLQAPDCYRDGSAPSTPSSAKNQTGPFSWKPTELDVQQQYTAGGSSGMSPGRLAHSSHSPFSSPGKAYSGLVGPMANDSCSNSGRMQQGFVNGSHSPFSHYGTPTAYSVTDYGSPGKTHTGPMANDNSRCGSSNSDSLQQGYAPQINAVSNPGRAYTGHMLSSSQNGSLQQSCIGNLSPLSTGPLGGLYYSQSPGTVYTGPLATSPAVMQQGAGSTNGGRGQYSPASRQYSPRGQQYSPGLAASRQYSPRGSGRQSSGQGSTQEEGATAEVYISLSPLKEGAGAGKK